MHKTIKTTISLFLAATLLASFGMAFAAGQIGLSAAKRIALDHANVGMLSRLFMRFTEAKLDKEDGTYDLEFRFNSMEYDYEIDAFTGSIREFDNEFDDDIPLPSAAAAAPAEATTPAVDAATMATPAVPKAANKPVDDKQTEKKENAKPAADNTAAKQPTDGISLEKAKDIATEHAGVKAPTFIKAHEDRDDGRRVYDVEFYDDKHEYEYEIDFETGAIREMDKDRIEYDDFYDNDRYDNDRYDDDDRYDNRYDDDRHDDDRHDGDRYDDDRYDD